MIKQLSFVGAAVLSLGILAGCSSSGAQEQRSDADTYQSGSGEEYRGSEATSQEQTVVREQPQTNVSGQHGKENQQYGKESQTR